MPYQIRLAAIDDLAALPSIERAAAALFPADDLPPALRAQTLPAQDLCDAQRQGRLWVAQAGDGTVAGFALAPAALCPHLSAALAGEAALGLRRRVAMRLPLDAVAD